jgi:hypothetical protein
MDNLIAAKKAKPMIELLKKMDLVCLPRKHWRPHMGQLAQLFD